MQGRIFASALVCVLVLKTSLFFFFKFRFLHLFFRSALQLLAQPFLLLSLNVSWILEGAEKLLDYREYYCGLKYVSLYVGALSPCTMTLDDLTLHIGGDE